MYASRSSQVRPKSNMAILPRRGIVSLLMGIGAREAMFALFVCYTKRT